MQQLVCCRKRVESDIEASRPLVVVGVGDEPLRWATGLPGGALTFRGQLIPIKVGRHVCWFFPIIAPNYAKRRKNQKGRTSQFELAVQHDLKNVIQMVEREELPVPVFFDRSEVYKGVQVITGQGPDDFQILTKALQELKGAGDVGLDFETSRLSPWHDKDSRVYCVSVGTFERTVSFPLDDPRGWPTESRRKAVWSLFINFLLEHQGRKQAHNLAMEMEWSSIFIDPKILRLIEWEDTMAMAYVLDERPGSKSLDVQTRLRFGFFLKDCSRVDPVRFLEFPIEEGLLYCGGDAKWTNKLARHYLPILKARGNEALLSSYERKVRLASTLVLTQNEGLPVDFNAAQKLHDDYADRLAKIEGKIKRCPEVQAYERKFGRFEPTNPDSVFRMLDKICQRDEIRVEERDGTERESTDESVLSSLPADEVPSAPLILEHRALSKLDGTYLVPILSRKVVSFDDQIHARYSSMRAVTNRLAAEDPNVQNYPKRKHKEVRMVVIATEDGLIVAIDYGQIEFRVVGMASEDPRLIEYCWTGYDVHKFWAERMVEEYPKIKDRIVQEFKVDWEESGLKLLRQDAKNMWVFPQLFGSSVQSCAAQLGLPLDIAEDLEAEFWDDFRVAKRWQEKILKFYERNLYVETLGGHRRRGLMTKNEIINLPIQGTAAEIVTEGMNAVSELAMIKDLSYLQPRLNVHDDLSFWIPKQHVEEAIPLLATEMCRHRFDFINVPLVVEVSTGPNWADLKEIKKYYSNELFNIPNPFTKKGR